MSDTHGTSYLDEDTDFDMLLEDDFDVETTDRPRRGIPKIGRPRPRDAYKPARLRANPNWSRIAAAGFVAVIFLFIVVFGVSSFMSHRKQAAYASYFTSVRELVVQSDAEGQEFDALMSKNGGVDRTQLVEGLQKLADQSATLATNARALTPPTALKPSHEWFVSTLDYRHNGLLAERKALTSALVAKDKTAAASTLAEAGQVLLAGDVMYVYSYAAAARAVLLAENISGLTVPDSPFVKDPEIGSPKAQALALERLSAAAPAAPVGKDGKLIAPKDGKISRCLARRRRRLTIGPDAQRRWRDQNHELSPARVRGDLHQPGPGAGNQRARHDHDQWRQRGSCHPDRLDRLDRPRPDRLGPYPTVRGAKLWPAADRQGHRRPCARREERR